MTHPKKLFVFTVNVVYLSALVVHVCTTSGLLSNTTFLYSLLSFIEVGLIYVVCFCVISCRLHMYRGKVSSPGIRRLLGCQEILSYNSIQLREGIT